MQETILSSLVEFGALFRRIMNHRRHVPNALFTGFVRIIIRIRQYALIVTFVIGYLVSSTFFVLVLPQYLGYFLLAIALGITPAAITVLLAVRLADTYVIAHQWWFRNAPEAQYKTDTEFRHAPPRLRIVARATLISTFGILSLIISGLGFDQDLLSSTDAIGIITFSLLPAIFLAPALNISAWLLIRSGTMYENKRDGTRINIGRELRRTMEFVIGPFAAVNFFRAMWSTFDNPGLIISFAAFALILSGPSIIVTMIMLRQRTLGILSRRLNQRLQRHIF